MLFIVEWGQNIINGLLECGDFLFINGSGIPGFENVSIAFVLCGAGLVAVLGFKLVKFILDIVF